MMALVALTTLFPAAGAGRHYSHSSDYPGYGDNANDASSSSFSAGATGQQRSEASAGGTKDYARLMARVAGAS